MSDDETPPLDETPSDAAAPEEAKSVYDQAFFLDLARPRADTDEARTEARERWNAWRRKPENAGVRVTFEGVDFRTEENEWISFSGFEFGDYARFNGACLAAMQAFDGAVFGDWARFDGAYFSRISIFSGAVFGFAVNFRDSYFYDESHFFSVTFGSFPRFNGTIFSQRALFSGATFGSRAEFIDVTFCDAAIFAGQFGDLDVESKLKYLSHIDESQRKYFEKNYREERENAGVGPARFSSITFASARFHGTAYFSRRSFERPTDFTGACFDSPPDFDGATNIQRINFTGTRVGFVPAGRPWWKPDWTTDSRTALRLRALRSQIEGTKNHDFERDLYIEERKAERGIYFARLWKALRFSRFGKIARAFIGGLPRWPTIDLFAGQGGPVVRWPEMRRNRRTEARPALIDRQSVAARRLRRAYRREGARFLVALGPFVGHCLWIAVMALYWALSDYGRSWLRPAAWLVASIPAFDLVYTHLLADRRESAVTTAREAATKSLAGQDALAVVRGWQAAEARIRVDYDAVVGQLAVSNAVPFVGPLTVDADAKKFLFCGVWPTKGETATGTLVEPCRPIPPPGFQLATISQNLLSIVLVFFIGLALRNYFRVK